MELILPVHHQIEVTQLKLKKLEVKKILDLQKEGNRLEKLKWLKLKFKPESSTSFSYYVYYLHPLLVARKNVAELKGLDFDEFTDFLNTVEQHEFYVVYCEDNVYMWDSL